MSVTAVENSPAVKRRRDTHALRGCWRRVTTAATSTIDETGFEISVDQRTYGRARRGGV
ncbi:hypothetical protein Hamer_G002576 [Homarus americanus]|uniref:Uncharacterized protein n=1 Tax=Homarus americanus TaxID=6706 RepID=A0A8J5K6B9_HOMAM|nr:hypothetical protein Hamer_G002576 [Homarus americanus]